MKKQLDLQYSPFETAQWFRAMHINAISPFNRKVVAATALVCVVIGMFDSFIDMAIWLFHNLIELLHTLFEMFEISLDRLFEHLFHTSLHATQTIVFYIMLSLAVWVGYKLWYGLPCWYRSLLDALENFWLEQKYSALYDWETQSVLDKIISMILAALCCIAVYFLIL